jgi:hypothetical protein
MTSRHQDSWPSFGAAAVFAGVLLGLAAILAYHALQ